MKNMTSDDGMFLGYILAMIVAMLLLVVCLVPFVSFDVGISVNSAVVSLLPSSFEGLAFHSDDIRPMQVLQLFFANLPMVAIGLMYILSYVFVFVSCCYTGLKKIPLGFLAVYLLFYFVGFVCFEWISLIEGVHGRS